MGNVVLQDAEGGADPRIPAYVFLEHIIRLLGGQLVIVGPHAFEPDVQVTS